MDSGLGYVVVMSLCLTEMSCGSDVCSLFEHTGYSMFLPMARSDSEFIIKFQKALVPCVCVCGGIEE